MPSDRYGLSLPTTPPAAAVYVDAVDRLLAAREGRSRVSIARSPPIPASRWPTSAVAEPAGRRSRPRGAGRRGGGTGARGWARAPRAANTWRPGRRRDPVPGDRAIALIREHLAEFPRDVVALAAATGIYVAHRREPAGRIATRRDGACSTGSRRPTRRTGVPGRVRLRAHRGLGWKAGAPLIERSLALEARTPTPRTRGLTCSTKRAGRRERSSVRRGLDPRLSAGGGFALSTSPGTGPSSSWAAAAWTLLSRSTSRAIAPGRSMCSPFSTVVDSASLLWRRELAGAPPRAEAWRAVARPRGRHVPGFTGLAFLDAHCALALAAAGDSAGLERWSARLREADAEGRAPSGPVTPAVAAAMGAFAVGRLRRDDRGARPGARPRSFGWAEAGPSAICSSTRCWRPTCARGGLPMRGRSSPAASIANRRCRWSGRDDGVGPRVPLPGGSRRARLPRRQPRSSTPRCCAFFLRAMTRTEAGAASSSARASGTGSRPSTRPSWSSAFASPWRTTTLRAGGAPLLWATIASRSIRVRSRPSATCSSACIRGGLFRARFGRVALQQLAPFLLDTGRPGPARVRRPPSGAGHRGGHLASHRVEERP